MSDIAIRVENLSKRYRIGLREERPDTLGRALFETVRRPLANLQRLRGLSSFGFDGRDSPDTIWALRDVSFEVKQGEAVGIIGRNGAGKSTLLKILSRITYPTSGQVTLHGRVASLLEVGTGFHPELTGRENIYLNGTILGMRKAEIDRKLDEIVAFAEIEKFLDTPVKRYSSGMYVRLAFAVAAHLEPEILIVDEVLAVGDIQFQKKCLGKMADVASGGRTVLFVSHNMQAVRQLCGHSILLAQGSVSFAGPMDETADRYLVEVPAATSPDEVTHLIAQLPPDPAMCILGVDVCQDGQWTTVVGNGKPVEVGVAYEVFQSGLDLRVVFDLVDSQGTVLLRSYSDDDVDEIRPSTPGQYYARATIPADLLAAAPYELRIFCTVFNVRQCVAYPGIRIPLWVEANGRVNRAHPTEPFRGKLAPLIPWVVTPVSGNGALSADRGDAVAR